ncbi:hypothetical protein [Promicromonospora aerolata]|jgi:hypothetical protein|uniref:Uncharacterized protein n=1 Tax=Promicromonospora aerolata TaxID=195749 RepID=A0ABW4VCG6_9MICO
MKRPELTPHEQELLDESLRYRGYTPDDDVPEPAEGPLDPAGPSASAVDPSATADQSSAPDSA